MGIIILLSRENGMVRTIHAHINTSMEQHTSALPQRMTGASIAQQTDDYDAFVPQWQQETERMHPSNIILYPMRVK